MLNRDGDDHRRLRRLVTKAFTPRMVEQLRPRIQEIADELIDAVESRGSMDLSAEYAFPLPITVIAELLGVPNADQDRFKEWSDAIITPAIGPEAMERFFGLMGEFVEYLTELFAARRAEPQDDLVSALLAARDEEDALTEEEVFGTVVLLIVAGHETTVGLIGNAVVNLLTHPDQLELVRADRVADPGRGRGGAALRGPRRAGAQPLGRDRRRARRPDDPAGELVIAILNAADRDPRSLRRSRPARRPARGHAASRLRARQPLLPRRSARAAGGGDRARDAVPAAARASARRGAERARMAADAGLPAARDAARSPGSR